jgi:tetratricopeptide (TPR) repeat protein
MGVNLVLAVFNLLPAYPLDGGRIVRAGLTMLAGETRANQVTAGLGWVWGALIIALGVFLGDFIMVFVGVVVLFTSSLLPQSLQAPINLGLAFVFDRGAYHIQRGDYAQGIAHYTRVLERNPHQIKALQNRGHALMLQQCPDAALADFERMVALAPDNSHAYLNRGWAYSELRDYQRAYADFEQALQLQPNFSLAMVNRGLMHMRMGDMARAEADFRQGIALNPQEGLAYNNLACLLLVQGDPAQALEYCNQAFQYASQGMPHLYDTRAQAYHMLGQHVLAIADINQAIELRPDYAGHYFVRGSAYAALGEHSRALAECDETVRCGLDVALVEQDLHACVGFNPAWAHAYYSRMLELRPDDALAYRGRGDVHRLMGEMPKAIADYDQALLLDPDLAEAYLGRGHAYSQCFALMQAVSDFEQVGAHTTLPGPRHEAATMLHTLGVV